MEKIYKLHDVDLILKQIQEFANEAYKEFDGVLEVLAKAKIGHEKLSNALTAEEIDYLTIDSIENMDKQMPEEFYKKICDILLDIFEDNNEIVEVSEGLLEVIREYYFGFHIADENQNVLDKPFYEFDEEGEEGEEDLEPNLVTK